MARFRHELKYILPLNRADELFEDALSYCDYDPHVNATHSYEIASIYYDTADLRFYYDREESVGYRRKIRLRSYNTQGKSTALFIEIKEKHKQFVNKKRVNLKSPEILDRFEFHNQIPLGAILEELEDSDAARELLYLQDRLELFPVVNIRYHRRPLIPRYENDMRITLDTRITAGGENLAMYNDAQEKSIIAPDLGVFEVKTNQAVPMWLQSILCRYSLPQTRYSKYCLGVDAIFGRGGKQWLLSSNDDVGSARSPSSGNGGTAGNGGGSSSGETSNSDAPNGRDLSSESLDSHLLG
ncbi:polyphosphate polymerase domain-containing protein [bacterium]|nr:polyphosphate polymerase domain-containing protein [bacterium]